MAVWQYEQSTRRYREAETGRFLGRDAMIGLRDQFVDKMKERAAGLASELKAGTRTAAEWEAAMRRGIVQTHVDLAVLGRGGRAMMTPSDWGRVGREIRDQFAYLGKFADATPDLSEAQIAARSGLYVESATASYERANAAAAGLPALDQYPSDGQTICGTNCRCSLEIIETEDGWDVTWHANDDPAVCEDCAALAAEWSPLVVAREEAAVAA